MATGQGTRDTAEEIANYADQIEKTTGIQAEAIQNQVAYAVSMGFTKKEALELTEASLGLAAATNDSVDSSMKKLIGTLNGSHGQLGKQVQGFKELTKEQLINGEGVKLVNERFGKLAKENAQNLETRLKILGHVFGDVTEQLGTVVARNTTVNTSVSTLTDTFKKVNIIVGNLTDSFDDFLNTTLAPFPMVLEYINKKLDEYIRRQEDAKVGATKYADEVSALTKTLSGLQEEYDSISRNLEARGKWDPFIDPSITEEKLGRIKTQIDEYTTKLTEAQEKLRMQRNEKSIGASGDWGDDEEDKNRKIGESEEVKKAREAKLKADADAAQQSIDRTKALADQEHAVEYANLLRKGEIDAAERGMFESTAEYKARLQQQVQDGKMSQFDMDIALYGQQEALEMQALQRKIDAANTAGNAKEAEALKYEMLEKRKGAATNERVAEELKYEQMKAQAVQSILGDLSSLTSSSNRKAFEVGKAAAIAQTIMNTIMGAQNAFNSLSVIPIVGPALGIAAAGAAIAAGMNRVAQIKAQQPPKMANGGTIGMDGKLKSSSAYGDQAMFMGNRGEDVLNLKEQRVLKRYIGSGSSLNSELLASIENKMGQAPVIYLDRTKVSEEISNEQNRRLS
jgi:hypothetical protein